MAEKLEGTLLIVSGPSGVGKDTVLGEVLKLTDPTVKKFAAYTTRSPRTLPDGRREIHNVDYRFLPDHDAFWALHERRPMFDVVKIPDHEGVEHLYGTPVADFENVFTRGKRRVMHLAVDSALRLKERINDVTIVYLHTPSPEARIARLRKRGMSEEAIAARVLNDPDNPEHAARCDLRLVNGDGQARVVAEHIVQFAELPRLMQAEYSVPDLSLIRRL